MVAATLVQALRRAVGDQAVTDRAIDLSRFAHDASHYLLRPQAVVLAGGTSEVARAVAVARAHGVGVTFRSGGTSLPHWPQIVPASRAVTSSVSPSALPTSRIVLRGR